MQISKVYDEYESILLGFNADEDEQDELEREVSQMDEWEYLEFMQERYGRGRED